MTPVPVVSTKEERSEAMSGNRERWVLGQVTGWNCSGSIHTIPVPRWMTPEEVWEQLGRGEVIPEDPECTWANVECPGGEACECRTHPISDTYTHHHNDVLLYDHASTLALETD